MIVLDHHDGRLQVIVRAPDGHSMIILGPEPGIGSLGFTFRFKDLRGMPQEWSPKEYATVSAVDPRSAAWEAGLRRGDVVLAVDGKDGLNPWIMRDRTPGTIYQLKVGRGSERHDVRVVVGPAPSREEVEWQLRREAGCVRQATAVSGGLEEAEGVSMCILPF